MQGGEGQGFGVQSGLRVDTGFRGDPGLRGDTGFRGGGGVDVVDVVGEDFRGNAVRFGEGGILFPRADEDLLEGGFTVVLGEGGFRGDAAEFGVVDDLFDSRFGGELGVLRGEAREVDGGDLKAVEEKAGAARIDLVEGDAGENLCDGELDGGTILDEGQVEGGTAAFALTGVLEGAAGGVVEVAEGFPAEADAAALAAVGVDVAALEAFGLRYVDEVCVWHVSSPPTRVTCAKYSIERS